MHSRTPQTYASTAVDLAQFLEHLLVNALAQYVDDVHVGNVHVVTGARLELALLEQLIEVAAIVFERIQHLVLAHFFQESEPIKRTQVEGTFVFALFASSRVTYKILTSRGLGVSSMLSSRCNALNRPPSMCSTLKSLAGTGDTRFTLGLGPLLLPLLVSLKMAAREMMNETDRYSTIFLWLTQLRSF